MENAQHTSGKNWYDRHYKILLVIPAILIVSAIVYLAMFYAQNGDFLRKDVSLTGGTSVTVFDSNVDAEALVEDLRGEFPDMQYRVISDFRTGDQHGFTVETIANSTEIVSALEEKLGYQLNEENSSVEFSGSALSSGFYQQLIAAMVAAFLLMSWVVFTIFTDSWKVRSISTILAFFGVAVVLKEVSWLKYISVILIVVAAFVLIFNKNSKGKEKLVYFIGSIILILLIFLYPNKILVLIDLIALIIFYVRQSIPSLAVIFAAFADILLTVAVVDFLGIHVSTAGIVAFLMLIGYSVDTDILLTSRLLRNREGSVNKRLYDAFKTGMTMTLTAIAAVGVSFIIVYSFSDTLRQIFGIILIGLVFDIINTWVTNASMLKWYMEVKKLT